MKILYVGFKGRRNSSCQLASSMPGDKYFLTNSFTGVKRDIDCIHGSYDAVYLFGLDKTLINSIRIELFADADGRLLHTNADIAALSRKLNCLGIQYTASGKPTHFLCNEAYCRLLQKMTCPVLLIHIPSQRNFPEKLFSQLLTAFTFETFTIR